MANTLEDLQREIGARNRQRAAALKESASPPPAADRSLGLAFGRGARVLDLVTGEEGTIIDATAEHIITRHA